MRSFSRCWAPNNEGTVLYWEKTWRNTRENRPFDFVILIVWIFGIRQSVFVCSIVSLPWCKASISWSYHTTKSIVPERKTVNARVWVFMQEIHQMNIAILAAHTLHVAFMKLHSRGAHEIVSLWIYGRCSASHAINDQIGPAIKICGIQAEIWWYWANWEILKCSNHEALSRSLEISSYRDDAAPMHNAACDVILLEVMHFYLMLRFLLDRIHK